MQRSGTRHLQHQLQNPAVATVWAQQVLDCSGLCAHGGAFRLDLIVCFVPRVNPRLYGVCNSSWQGLCIIVAQPQFQFCFAYMSAHAIRGLAIIVCEIDLFFSPHNVFVF
jgi:hypothetical protein